MIRWLLLLLLLLLAGCAAPVVPVQEQVAEEVVEQQRDAAQAVVPMVLAVQDAAAVVAEALPLPHPAQPVRVVTPETAALIVRWEVTSPATYARRYEGPICPGGASGPTIGIGYDLGHQSQAVIRRDWADHPDVERLVTGSGVIGETPCRVWRAQHRDIRVSFAQAQDVFALSTLPTYHGMASRAFRNGWDGLSPNGQGANVSMVYNRGASMVGSRNSEKRAIRDDCVPPADHPCIAGQLRAMCRIWAGTPNGRGLCARREDEARLATT